MIANWLNQWVENSSNNCEAKNYLPMSIFELSFESMEYDDTNREKLHSSIEACLCIYESRILHQTYLWRKKTETYLQYGNEQCCKTEIVITQKRIHDKQTNKQQQHRKRKRMYRIGSFSKGMWKSRQMWRREEREKNGRETQKKRPIQ